MGFITRLLFFSLPLLVQGNICNEPVRLNSRQQKSSLYCSSCSIHIGGQTSSPIIQLEMSSLTQLTGINVQYPNNDDEEDNEKNSKGSYFLEYRRTQDGPWRAYGQRRQRKIFIERRRLFFNDNDNSNRTRTFLPSIIARQVRLIFLTASISTCARIQLFGCQSQSGLISTRFSHKSILNSDVKYDGLITNTTVRGGIGTLNDGDTYQFLRWSPSPEPILLLFAFDSIREFHSINLDLKCSVLFSSSCAVKINVGILDIVSSNNIWTNRFQSLEIENSQQVDNTTITHLILAVAKTKGQFVIIQVNTKEGLALSEVTFHNQNENNEEDIVPSSIYIENNLRRLESIALTSIPDDIKLYGKLLHVLLLIIVVCTVLAIFLFISCIFTRKQKDEPEAIVGETVRSLASVTTTTDDDNTQNQSHGDVYSELDNNDIVISNCLEYINAEKIVNESARATIRALPSYRQSAASRYSISNIVSLTECFTEIDSSDIIIIQNLGVQNHHECFYSEYGQSKTPVILLEEEKNEFFNLSKSITHANIVTCFGYVNVSPERCFLVSEFSQMNLFEHCQTLLPENSSTLTTLMDYLNQIISALVHIESLKIIIRDLTLPNCLLFDSQTIKLSDYAKKDDRYSSRYVQQIPIRWLPGDIIAGDENWSIQTTIFMFGTLLFELFHLGLYIPYHDLNDDEVLQFFRDVWSNSKQNGIEPSVLCFATHFPRPTLCNDRLYALIERCLSWSSLDRPSFRELSLCLDETATVLSQ
ncbi:unnamed protein product [Adineta ricciae]|uniref:Protein kinase domain-containing protein n=1 Tax=Adineta ricciae TaxID=249248 RepID=A0A814J5R2_ADIRI|nr:unnamed protein product [Adineta ricciae]